MFTGAHIIIYSQDAEADRKVFRDVLGFSHVDTGGGWLIFRLPPSEIAMHPHETSGAHEFYLMCNDIEEACSSLRNAGFVPEPVADEGWGLLSAFMLPGGSRVGFYQPRHPSP